MSENSGGTAEKSKGKKVSCRNWELPASEFAPGGVGEQKGDLLQNSLQWSPLILNFPTRTPSSSSCVPPTSAVRAARPHFQAGTAGSTTVRGKGSKHRWQRETGSHQQE